MNWEAFLYHVESKLGGLYFTLNILFELLLQVLAFFPSSEGLEVIWSSVVKIGQSLYREAPRMNPFRPDQKTPVK
ncbi:hypothetical protein Scep_025713 [Stephania cephalantha]|uniref:Uncharacterized protein n=1 Tax=Stephania cephalantha TaxID=152367 RepID=A0AAP0HPL9_9MAGN